MVVLWPPPLGDVELLHAATNAAPAANKRSCDRMKPPRIQGEWADGFYRALLLPLETPEEPGLSALRARAYRPPVGARPSGTSWQTMPWTRGRGPRRAGSCQSRERRARGRRRG